MGAPALLFACSVLGASAQSFDEELDLNELVPDIPMPSPKLPSLLSLAGRSASPSPAPSTMGPLSLYLGTHATQSQPAVQTKAETTELLSDSLRGKSLKPYDLYDEAVKKIFGSECYGGKSCGPTKVQLAQSNHARRAAPFGTTQLDGITMWPTLSPAVPTTVSPATTLSPASPLAAEAARAAQRALEFRAQATGVVYAGRRRRGQETPSPRMTMWSTPQPAAPTTDPILQAIDHKTELSARSDPSAKA